MQAEEQVTIRVYGQEFKLRVAPRDKELLEKAAALVDQRMQEIASAGVLTLHRIAILTAIDFAFQTLTDAGVNREYRENKATSPMAKSRQKINQLIERIDEVLAQQIPSKEE